MAIGVFDSGLGGLTIVKAVQELLPNESIVYYGDTAHLPYGDKSPDLVREYAAHITEFLCKKQVKAIIIACNTASALAADVVTKKAGDIPVFNVIDPASEEAINKSRAKNIGVIGTKATIRSGIYRRKIENALPGARVIEKATPLLAPLIEEGWLHNAISKEVIEAYLSDTGFVHIDSLILGCTHYPLIKPEVEAYFKENASIPVEVVDSSEAVARWVKKSLGEKGLLADASAKPVHQFFASDFSQNFEASARLFLDQDVVFQKAE